MRWSYQDWTKIPGFDRKKEEYVRLDLKKWLAENKIEEQGRHLGTENQPPPGANSLDAAESNIVDWINYRARRCREDISAHLSDLERDLADKEDSQELEILEHEVSKIRNEAKTSLEQTVNKGRNDLMTPENDVRVGSQDFDAFRLRSRLTRLADYSHRSGKTLLYIGGCWVIELFLNGSLLMEVNAFGLLGSIMQMGLISAVNVLALGLTMGALLRQRNHIAISRQVCAWLGIVLLIGLIFCFNLAVGHFRDSMQAILNDPSADFLTLGNDALQRVLADPFGLDSFQSAFLAVLGLICFAFASWKWFQYDDPYPDYGPRDRQLKEKTALYIEAYNGAQDALKKKHEDYVSRLEDIRHRLQIKQSLWLQVCTRGQHLVDNYPINLHQYQLDLNYLLRAYRSANQSTRTEPAPDHFSREEKVDSEVLEPPSFNPPDETSIKGVADRVHAAITELQNVYREAAGKYLTLEEVTRQEPEYAP